MTHSCVDNLRERVQANGGSSRRMRGFRSEWGFGLVEGKTRDYLLGVNAEIVYTSGRERE